MSIIREDAEERQTRVDRMLAEFRKAQSRRLPRPQHAGVTTAPERVLTRRYWPASVPHVPPEYRSLYAYLDDRRVSAVALTFAQIESLLGFPLPTLARTDREWWTNGGDTQRHVAAWTTAGRTAAPNLDAGTVMFERPNA